MKDGRFWDSLEELLIPVAGTVLVAVLLYLILRATP